MPQVIETVKWKHLKPTIPWNKYRSLKVSRLKYSYETVPQIGEALLGEEEWEVMHKNTLTILNLSCKAIISFLSMSF